jgi:hypothetical protein
MSDLLVLLHLITNCLRLSFANLQSTGLKSYNNKPKINLIKGPETKM